LKVAVIGSGGREHALAYKIRESKSCSKLFILPGNPGTKAIGNNVEIDIKNYKEILNFCLNEKIDLVVIGPEVPLVEGLSDLLRENNINVFGPNKNAAEIEGHKSFAKQLMKEYKIPTANFAEFDSTQLSSAKKYLETADFPLVVKADGLAAGKGVLICENLQEGLSAIDELFVNKIFGESGEKIVIEEFLTGQEASIFAITDGEKFICLPSSQDHKRIGDGDTGKNTGGMGAYSPAPIVTEEILKKVEEEVIRPTLRGLNEKNRKFIGCLYCGLMITAFGPKVIEYNCRFGDPETQAVLPLLKGDFLSLLYSASIGKLDENVVSYSGGAAVCVVTASKGYPDKYEKGFEISGLDDTDNQNIIVFHAGTKESNGKIITNGGRVLGVTSFIEEPNLALAKNMAYDALSKIHFDGINYRNDIADKGIARL